jgi:hypothetical protein
MPKSEVKKDLGQVLSSITLLERSEPALILKEIIFANLIESERRSRAFKAGPKAGRGL